MNPTSALTSFVLALGCTSIACADISVIGKPLDYIAPGVFNPGIGEATVSEVVPRMGQTFVVPAGHPYLSTWSFWLADSPLLEPQPAMLNAVLMAYGTDSPVGPVLFQSGPHSLGGLLHGENRRFDFNVGVNLDPLATYVFFLDVVPYLDGIPNFATFASAGAMPDIYTVGTLVQSASAIDLDHVADIPWQEAGLGWDSVFRGEFHSVPEPSSTAAWAIVLCALAKRRPQYRGEGSNHSRQMVEC
jgi:hypothetical protein